MTSFALFSSVATRAAWSRLQHQPLMSDGYTPSGYLGESRESLRFSESGCEP